MKSFDQPLARLEAESRRLEPAGEQRDEWMAQALSYAGGFIDSLPGAQMFAANHAVGEAFEVGIAEEPASLEALLDAVREPVDSTGINPASGGHFGYIPGGGIFPSALGDFLSDVTNRYAGVAYASPGAVAMEQGLVRWMADLVGYGPSAGGDLTSGGSLANLGAVVAARDARRIGAREVPDCCIYLSRQTHHCVDKALRLAGLGEARLRYVPMDRLHRMNATELAGMVQADLGLGLKPFLVVGSAGTTDTGAVDPLVEMSQVAQAYGLWFHVDAAYGGFFLLTERGRRVLRGLSKADSIVMDPHKGLFLPYGTGALLVRDVQALAKAHAYEADYMQDAHQPGQAPSPADLSAELSRPFRGMRMWLPLRLFGLAPFRAALEEKLLLARYFHARLNELPGWETGPAPDLSVVTFRYLPGHGDADAANRRLLQAVHEEGRTFITSTLVDGRFTLRAAVLHFRTHRAEVDHLLDVLTTTASTLDDH